MKTLILLLTGCGAATPATVTIPAQVVQGIIDASQVKSFELWVLDQVGRDGSPIQCQTLLDRTLAPGAGNVIALKSPVQGDFSGQRVVLKNIPAGKQNRVFYVDLFNSSGALGTRIGAGCVPSVTIVGGKQITVDIDIVSKP